MLKTLFRGMLLIGGVVLFLGGIIWLGQVALDQLRGHDRYKVRFTDIHCTSPAGMSRVDFLDEVQYLAGLPAELALLEKGLPQKLAEAFARHPWVEKVERVQILPANTIQVHLQYRTPVLAVPWDGQLRAVDSTGILLPGDAATEGLAVFSGKPQPPQGPAGTAWGDTAIHAAAQQAGQENSNHESR